MRYYRSEFYRNEYIKHLNLPREIHNNPFLWICDSHALVTEMIRIPWKNINEEEKVLTEEIVLLIDVENSGKTRSATRSVVLNVISREEGLDYRKRNQTMAEENKKCKGGVEIKETEITTNTNNKKPSSQV
jgi:hypothetical protein